LWLAQYLLLDRVLFRARSAPRADPEEPESITLRAA
ncbi:MAG: hypothetical protein QOF81_1380, partial [Acidimicrobiaceae bacterium]|nr:hypothetical protein [Acidimicrobiaceae bacterium]